jgi:DNA-binding transcriptional ArsR family regulator
MPQEDAEETYSVIYSALKHPIRRKILRMLSDEQLSYTQMLKELDLDTGHLNYYLESLGELVLKSEEGKYRLSEMGQAAIGLMKKVEDRATQEKEITWLKQQKRQKRRTIILLQTFAIIMLLVASFVFFNVKFETSASGNITVKNPPDIIIQPNQIITSSDFINTQQFQQNSSVVNRQYFYKLDITTNSTLWIQVIGGVIDNEVTSLGNVRPESTLLFNDTVSGSVGPLSKMGYELLISLPNRDIGIYDGLKNGFMVQVRIANLGQQTINEGVLPGTIGEFEMISTAPFVIKTIYPYFYYGVAFLLLLPVAILLPYLSNIKKILFP